MTKVFLVKISDKEQERDLLYGDIVDEAKELTPSELAHIEGLVRLALIQEKLHPTDFVDTKGLIEAYEQILKKLSEVSK